MIDKRLFHKFIDQLAFLEPAKDSTQGFIGKLGKNPIPILQEDIIKEAKRQKNKDTDLIDYESLIKGLLVILSLDREFPYWDKYYQILKEMGKEGLQYIEAKRRQALAEEKYDWAYIYLKASYILLNRAEDLYKANLILEVIYDQKWKERKNREDNGLLGDLLKEIQGNYEKILSLEPENSLANERLANIYIAKGQYVKARLYLEKALRGNGLEEDLDRIRVNLSEIEDQAFLEAAETYMVYSRFDEALDQLDRIRQGDFLSDSVNHLKGMAYYGLGQYDKSLAYLKEAFRINKKDSKIQNDLSVVLAATGQYREAIQVLSLGIEENPESRDLIYNRAILSYKQGDLDRAIKDFKSAYALEADQEVWELIQKLEGQQRQREET